MANRPLRRRGWAIGAAVVALVVAVSAADAMPRTSGLSPIPDSTWQANGRVRTIAVVGNIAYIGGDFTDVLPPAALGGPPVPRAHAAAFDTATGTLLPWNPNPGRTVWSLAIAGTVVYLAGAFTDVGGIARSHVAAVDAVTGRLLPWNPDVSGNVYAVAVGPDGQIYLGGAFSRVAGVTAKLLTRVTSAGALTQWRPLVQQVQGATCPPRCQPFVSSLAFSSDGTALYFTGHFGLVNATPRNNAAAVSVSSGETLPWNPDVFGTGAGQNAHQADKVWHVALGPDRAYLCGDYWSLDGFKRHPNLAAVDLVAGHLIRSFNATTDGNTQACTWRDGELYLGGHYQHVGPNSAWVFVSGQKAQLTGPGSARRNHLAAVDGASGAIDEWNPFVDSPLGVHTMTTTAAGLAIGGDFTRVGTTPQAHFAQFSSASLP